MLFGQLRLFVYTNESTDVKVTTTINNKRTDHVIRKLKEFLFQEEQQNTDQKVVTEMDVAEIMEVVDLDIDEEVSYDSTIWDGTQTTPCGSKITDEDIQKRLSKINNPYSLKRKAASSIQMNSGSSKEKKSNAQVDDKRCSGPEIRGKEESV